MPQPTPNAVVGLRSLPDKTFEHDMAVLDRYQSFSAEVARLALLGVTAIGALFVAAFGADKAPAALRSALAASQWAALLALSAFGAATLAALFHRYISTDSMAAHLRALRLRAAPRSGDARRAQDEEADRDGRLRASSRWLAVAAVCLAIGAVCFALTCGILIRDLVLHGV